MTRLAIRSRLLVTASALALAATLALTGCSSSDDTASDMKLIGKDMWVKTATSGMSAAFGELHNPTKEDVTVISATATEVTSSIELHEVTMVNGEMKMQPKQGGFKIAAEKSHTLKPGGDHLMLMNVIRPIKAGEKVTITLALSNKSTVEITALAKDFAGGNESYQPSMH